MFCQPLGYLFNMLECFSNRWIVLSNTLHGSLPMFERFLNLIPTPQTNHAMT